METVDVIFDYETGTYTIEVNGIAGQSCTSITEALTQMNQAVNQELTNDYYTPESIPDLL